MKSISDIPVSDTSTFLQRRLTLQVVWISSWWYVYWWCSICCKPVCTCNIFLLARRAGLMLTDPVALRYMNDALLPEEQLKLLKGGNL